MTDFVAEHGCAKVFVEPESELNIPGPKFVGKYPILLHAIETVSLRMPRIDAVEIPGAVIMGGTELVMSNACAIHPDVLEVARDVMPAENFGVVRLELQKKVATVRVSRMSERRTRAVSLLGQCTGNYAHWLTETLPKLVIVNELPEFDGLPLVVDQWLHPNCYQSLELLNASGREIIDLARWKTLALSSVVQISAPGYVPYESRAHLAGGCFPEPIPEVPLFSAMALQKLRKALWAACAIDEASAPKRLYLERRKGAVGNGKLVENISAVRELLCSHGFEAIDPGELNFAAQVAIFRSAECIVGSVGAGLANAILAPTGCRVVALAPYYENANYYYFGNLMGVLGHDLRYVLGPQVETKGHIAHRNYSVDLEALREALECFAN